MILAAVETCRPYTSNALRPLARLVDDDLPLVEADADLGQGGLLARARRASPRRSRSAKRTPSDGAANTSRNESPCVSTSRPSKAGRRSRTTAWCRADDLGRAEVAEVALEARRADEVAEEDREDPRLVGDAELLEPLPRRLGDHDPVGSVRRVAHVDAASCRGRRRAEDRPPQGYGARGLASPCAAAASGHRTRGDRASVSRGGDAGPADASARTDHFGSSPASSAASRRAGARCARVRRRGRSCRAGAAGGAPSRPSCCGRPTCSPGWIGRRFFMARLRGGSSRVRCPRRAARARATRFPPAGAGAPEARRRRERPKMIRDAPRGIQPAHPTPGRTWDLAPPSRRNRAARPLPEENVSATRPAQLDRPVYRSPDVRRPCRGRRPALAVGEG